MILIRLFITVEAAGKGRLKKERTTEGREPKAW